LTIAALALAALVPLPGHRIYEEAAGLDPNRKK